MDVEKPSSAARWLIVLRVVRVLDATAHDRVDVDVEVGVFGQPLQLLVEEPQALLRYVVGFDVVDADLQVVEPGLVQCLDPPRRHQVAVRDEAGDHPAAADARDESVEVRVEHRLPAAERDDRGAERRELVDPRDHLVGRHRRRHLVVLVAVPAVDVAPADRHDVDEQGMIGPREPSDELADRPRAPTDFPEAWHVATQYIRQPGLVRPSDGARAWRAAPCRP